MWETQAGEVTKYNLAYINHFVCQVDHGRVLGYDNKRGFHHRHWYDSCGGTKMKRSAKKLKVSTGTVEAFFERSLNRARKLDRGEKLPTEMRLTFEDPSDLLRVLTAQRVRVLRAVRKKPAAVTDLATVLKRDRTAVKRDVRILTSFGLVTIHEETNPGHGRRKIVAPLASKYELVATI